MDAKCIIVLLFHLLNVSCGFQTENGNQNRIITEENGGKPVSTSKVVSTVLKLASNVTGKSTTPCLIPIIVGGESLDIESAPYTVSLQYKGKHSCGGVILRNDLIITAAHCLIGYPVKDLTVRAGSSFNTCGGIVAQVRVMLPHPDYTYVTKSSDIGLAWLDQLLAYNDAIKPIALVAAGQEIEEGKEALVTGWGLISENGGFPKSLQGVEVSIVSTETCKNTYGNKILPSMICAGNNEGGQDACTYDSGGPLVYNHQLIGIVSWGRGCARSNTPGVYAKIAALREWIDDNMMPRPMEE